MMEVMGAKRQRGQGSGEKGFTLVEILIVLAVLAIMAAVVIPNVTGFLGRGKERAFDSDRRTLQAAVDAWRTDIGRRSGNPHPVLDTAGCIGTPATACNSYIDIAALATDKYLSDAAVVKSADKEKNTTATNTVSGSYGWFIDAGGTVKANPAFVDGRYP